MKTQPKEPNFTVRAASIIFVWLFRALLILGFWGLAGLAVCAYLVGAL